jgi:hypothetical protein
MNTQEAAEKLGLRSFDTALPQDWVDAFTDNTGVYPVGRFVWCYDVASIFGAPVALDEEARELLRTFEAATSR